MNFGKTITLPLCSRSSVGDCSASAMFGNTRARVLATSNQELTYLIMIVLHLCALLCTSCVEVNMCESICERTKLTLRIVCRAGAFFQTMSSEKSLKAL